MSLHQTLLSSQRVEVESKFRCQLPSLMGFPKCKCLRNELQLKHRRNYLLASPGRVFLQENGRVLFNSLLYLMLNIAILKDVPHACTKAEINKRFNAAAKHLMKNRVTEGLIVESVESGSSRGSECATLKDLEFR
uniref:Uncharacterized protein n=1 Tax=Parascaris univalens TaxID=6257 RepID=A0A915C5H6_PARUN